MIITGRDQTSTESIDTYLHDFRSSKARWVTTTLRTYSREPFQLDHHLNRLQENAQMNGFEIGAKIMERIRRDVGRLIQNDPQHDHLIKIIITPPALPEDLEDDEEAQAADEMNEEEDGAEEIYGAEEDDEDEEEEDDLKGEHDEDEDDRYEEAASDTMKENGYLILDQILVKEDEKH